MSPETNDERTLTLESFAAWLRSQPADSIYPDSRRSTCCPLAKFTGQATAVGYCGFEPCLTSPAWADTFIQIFDADGERGTTQADALRALELTEKRHKAALEQAP